VVSLRALSGSNRQAVEALRVSPSQERLVSGVAESLREAAAEPDGRALSCNDPTAHPEWSLMPGAFTKVSLAAVDDAAPGNGFGDRWEARVARDALAAERTGVTLFRLFPGKRSPFTHRHIDAEEIYVVLRGSGRVKLDDELFDVGPLDSIRVAPATGTGVRGRTGWLGASRLRSSPPWRRRAGGRPLD
jgi:mannose-6-phosphate isomerase-like protein (cupin superfamily)